MRTLATFPACLALILAVATTATAQDTRSTGHGDQHGEAHGSESFLQGLNQHGISENQLAAIHPHLEALHQSMEEMVGLHHHELSDRTDEEIHRAGESAVMNFHEAYEDILLELDEEQGRAFTNLLIRHLLHALPGHGGGGHGV